LSVYPDQTEKARQCHSSLTLMLACTISAHAATPNRQPATRPSRARNQPAFQTEPVKFATEDNVVIAGGYTRSRRSLAEKAPIVILLHMYNADRSHFDPLLPALHGAGFAVLAIDLRGHGESKGPPAMGLPQRVADRDPKLFRDMDKDVEGAYQWLREQKGEEVDFARFALVGASVGCSVALDYASQDKSVDAVACMTPGFNYLGLDSVAHTKKYETRPLMLIAADDEREAAEQLGRYVPDAAVLIVPNPTGQRMALHGTRMLGNVEGIERSIVDFLVKAVGPQPTEPVVASIKSKSGVYHDAESGTVRQISPENIRYFSSPAEAEARGLRPPRRGGKKSDAADQPKDAFPLNP
jgi:pimeloyl-ACP methyl ester carboxylesterase